MLVYFLLVISLLIMTLTIVAICRKNIFDKLLCIGSIFNITILFIIALGSYQYNSSFIDIAWIYTLLGFISTQAFLKYFSQEKVK